VSQRDDLGWEDKIMGFRGFWVGKRSGVENLIAYHIILVLVSQQIYRYPFYHFNLR
jgi:hypothetical protein